MSKMGEKTTCYAVFSKKYEQGRWAMFNWIRKTPEEVRQRLGEVFNKIPADFEICPVTTFQVQTGDIWRFPIGGLYTETPWVKVLDVSTRQLGFGESEWYLWLAPSQDFTLGERLVVLLPEAYLMLYAEFVEGGHPRG